MTDQELRLAIEQAHEHTRKSSPGADLDKARDHLAKLRLEQQRRARCET